MRRQAREVVFKILYSNLFNENDDEFIASLMEEEKLGEKDREFAQKLLDAINANREEIENVISSLAKDYKLERIYPTDRCALIIGICEMKYFKDIPNIVAIDEAIALCRIYSTAQSLSFVNGIFAEYKKIIESEGDNS